MRTSLGKDWQTLGFVQLDARARTLETATGLTRTPVDYMLDGNHRTAGEALAAVEERNGDSDYVDGYSTG